MNEEEEKKIVYNIPGVIIPPQQTDHGMLVSEEKEETKDITSTAQVSQVTTVKESNPTQNITPEIPKPPQQPTSIPVANPQLPPVANQTPPPNNQLPQQPVNKEKKSSKNTIYILIIFILLIIVSYFVYNDYLKPKKEIDPVKEWQRKRTANKNSLVVQELYNYINLDGCGAQINFFYNEKETVSFSDLTDENRNYLAYRQLNHDLVEKKNCRNHPIALHKNDQVGLWYCGEGILLSNKENYTDETDRTYVINGEVLKNQVNKMFGPDIYKAKTYTVSEAERYLYDSKTNSYIYQSFYGENACKGYTNKLENASQQGDNLILTVKVTNNENKSIQMFYYTFTEGDDGSYYFSSLNKRKI